MLGANPDTVGYTHTDTIQPLLKGAIVYLSRRLIQSAIEFVLPNKNLHLTL